jgi:hypothetical protein
MSQGDDVAIVKIPSGLDDGDQGFVVYVFHDYSNTTEPNFAPCLSKQR